MISFQVETWESTKDEAIPLYTRHWEAIELDKKKYKLDLDKEKLSALESLGMLHIVTARSNNNLIGYHVSVLDTLIHYRKILAAHSSSYWLEPSYRKGFTGIGLFKKVEKSLKDRGVQVIFENTKIYFNHNKILKWLGYSKIEYLYSKWIGD